MAEAKKRKSEIERLQAEVDTLRKAGQQLMVGLMEYGKKENWTHDMDGNVWTFWGDGWATARKYLGLEEDDHPQPLEHKE